MFPPLPPHFDVYMHPVAFAAWVGLLITSLNLIPIGQLDGGHVLYGMLRSKANTVATIILGLATAAVFAFQCWLWTLMLVLLFFLGSRHPPTADDDVPLGWPRYVLGVLILCFIPLGFTPQPFVPGEGRPEPPQRPQQRQHAPHDRVFYARSVPPGR